MTMLAEDPTAAAVLDAMPCYPMPPQGRSPAIETLRAAKVGRGLVLGADGLMLVIRRPWLELDVPVTPPPTAYLPFGTIGDPRADLRCGLIPADKLMRILEHFRAVLPNEAAAFVLWNERTRDFEVIAPVIEEASPSRLVYRPPALPADWHLVCDVHSHGSGPAFFSATDDTDDAHATKIALVFGRLTRPGAPEIVSRICADGLFLPLPRNPFGGGFDE